MLNALELTGRARTHVREFVVDDTLRFVAQPEAGGAFLRMRAAAAAEGIDLAPVSVFRDFDAQMHIWLRKWRGERPLYAADGSTVIDHATLDDDALIDAILEWSALPGASRHHWGSEFDVIDRAAIPPGYRPQLLPDEYAPGGPFERLGAWMPHACAAHGFFRPYDAERGGMHPEAWHLSWSPLSVPALAAMTPQLLRDAIAGAPDIPAREHVLARVDRIYLEQVCLVGTPNPIA